MTVIARISLLILAGIFVLNVAAGFIPALRPRPPAAAQAPQAQPVPVPVPGQQIQVQPAQPPAQQAPPEATKVVEDPATALSARFGPYANRRLFRLQDFKVERRDGDVVVSAVGVLEADPGDPWWYLGVDAALTALISDDGTWYAVKSTNGIGLWRGNEVLRRSPEWTPNVPRRIALRFPSPPVREVTLQVEWRAGGQYGLWSDARATRTVRLELPPLEEKGAQPSGQGQEEAPAPPPPRGTGR